MQVMERHATDRLELILADRHVRVRDGHVPGVKKSAVCYGRVCDSDLTVYEWISELCDQILDATPRLPIYNVKVEIYLEHRQIEEYMFMRVRWNAIE